MRTSPRRSATWPSKARIRVVLPMPLRPSNPTVSPGAMSRSTPCSTWLEPYHAFTSRARRKADGALMRASEVRVLHVAVVAHRGRDAARDDRAVDEHRDAIGDAEDGIHVVLDQHDRVAFAQSRQEGE